MRTKLARWSPVLAGLLALVVYLPRQCPTLAMQGDSAELVTAAWVWGVPHAPGYPLYTFVAHLFTKLPFSEVAHRVHLTSALYHALAVGLVARSVGRLTGSWRAGAAAGLCLAFARGFFMGSLFAEVLPLAEAFLAALVAVGVEIHLRSAPSSRLFYGFAALGGLAIAHHPIVGLAGAGILVLVGPELVRWMRARLVRAAGVLLVAAATYSASYGLVFLAARRDPPVSWGDVHDMASLEHLVLRRDYGGPFVPNKKQVIGTKLDRVGFWGRLTVESISYPGAALVLLGAMSFRRRTRRAVLASMLASAGVGPLFYVLGTLPEDFEASIAMSARFVTVSFVPMSILAGLALARADVWLVRRKRTRRLRWALLAAPVGLFLMNRDVTLREDRRGIAFAHDLIYPTEDDALVLVRGDHAVQAAQYVCFVERACGNRIVFSPGELFMPWRRAQVLRAFPEIRIDPDERSGMKQVPTIVEAALDGRPVYLLPELYVRDKALAVHPILPRRLLLRVYRDEEARSAGRDRFLEEARILAEGRCEGCNIRESALLHPSFEGQLVSMYAAALRNHALISRQIGEGPELATKLFERLHALEDQEFDSFDYVH
jgi:hypothetical protein